MNSSPPRSDLAYNDGDLLVNPNGLRPPSMVQIGSRPPPAYVISATANGNNRDEQRSTAQLLEAGSHPITKIIVRRLILTFTNCLWTEYERTKGGESPSPKPRH